jgi:excinuclease ABC subunit C
VEELESVPGIGPSLAQSVHAALAASAADAAPAVNVTTGEILD